MCQCNLFSKTITKRGPVVHITTGVVHITSRVVHFDIFLTSCGTIRNIHCFSFTDTSTHIINRNWNNCLMILAKLFMICTILQKNEPLSKHPKSNIQKMRNPPNHPLVLKESFPVVFHYYHKQVDHIVLPHQIVSQCIHHKIASSFFR